MRAAAAALSRYEANILAQPELASAALSAPRPEWMMPPVGRRIFIVGVGSNHHAARIAAWLWSRAGLDARAVHGFDFVARPQRLRRGDLGIFLSHRGGKSCTVAAEDLARRAGAETVIMTGGASHWRAPARRVETGPMEDTVAFTHSVTTTLVWLLRWPGKPTLLAPFKRLEESLSWGPPFPPVATADDLVILGDGLREWVARETALKLQETACLRCRAFGLEEFLHGPLLSVDAGSIIVGFSNAQERRWTAARRGLRAVGVPLVEAEGADWLAQMLWGQRFALDACKRLGVDPDLPRGGDPRYRLRL